MRAAPLRALVCAVLAAGALEAPCAAAATLELRSPNGALRAQVGDADSHLRLRLRRAGVSVLDDSPIGLKLDGNDLGAGARLGAVERYARDERFAWRGARSLARDRCNGARIAVSQASSRTRFSLELRLFDDAAAFRFVVPGSGSRVADAASSFRLPRGSVAWYHGPRDHYEGLYTRREIERVEAGEWLGVPLTYRLPAGAGFGSITEAALHDYAGMTLQAGGDGVLYERLGHAAPASYPYTLRFGEEEARRLSSPAASVGEVRTPWRVVLAGAELGDLVGSDAIAALSPPPDPGLFPQGSATPWLRPGRAVWRYLDGGGDCQQRPDGDERTSCTLEVVREFTRLAGELGFEHHVVEGQWRRFSEEQLRLLVDEARARGVDLWFWVHRRDLGTPEERERLFARLTSLGVRGIKADFFDHEARELIDLYEAVLRDAARHRLMVNFHGAGKPSGGSRTWPNEMTREAVRGLEYGRTPGWAEHNTILPFTRFLAGHADCTPLVFGERRKDTSWAHQIATLVVFTSPLMVYGAHPQSVLDNPARELIRSIPSVWDETRVLPGSAIGEAAAFARRAGESWFLGVLNGAQARRLRIALDFLQQGRYDALLVRDGERADAVALERRQHARGDALQLDLPAGGGFAARFTR